jgi:hypothetical protein
MDCEEVSFVPSRRKAVVGSATAPATAGHAVEADEAHAACLDASTYAIATALNHFAAGFIAAGAGEADAVFDQRALAFAHAQVALARRHAVHGATQAEHPAGYHFTQVLQGGRRHFIIALAGYLHAAVAFFDLHRATGDHAKALHRRR